MSQIEERLQRAAEEVRELARRQVKKPLPQPARRPHGPLVFAAAFAVVMLLGLIPMLMGGQEQTPAGTTVRAPSTTVAPPPSTTLAPTTTVAPTTTGPEVSCSSAGVPIPTPPQGLPQPVAEKYTAIAQAAASCDFAALGILAIENFTTSFGGGGGTENLELWEERGDGKLGILLQIMAMSHSVVPAHEDRGPIYVWPAAFAYDDWEDVPEEHREELLAIYGPEGLEWMAEFGGYAGWRTGIDENGEWLFFVAGD